MAAQQVAVMIVRKLAFSSFITAFPKAPSAGRYSQGWRWEAVCPPSLKAQFRLPATQFATSTTPQRLTGSQPTPPGSQRSAFLLPV